MVEIEMPKDIVVASVGRKRLILELFEVDKLRFVDEQEVERL